MSKFHVGQRVRLRYVREVYWHRLVGTEGRVIEVGEFPSGGRWNHAGAYKVVWDLEPERQGLHIAEQLEPAAYDGAAPSTWEECDWRPDGSHKKVAEEGRAIALRAVYE